MQCSCSTIYDVIILAENWVFRGKRCEVEKTAAEAGEQSDSEDQGSGSAAFSTDLDEDDQ